MSLLHDIVKWLDDQPDWVSDAARRIMQSGILADADIDDLAVMAQ